MTETVKIQEKTASKSSYLILSDPVLRSIFLEAVSDSRIVKAIEFARHDINDFISRVEKRLGTEMAGEDRKLVSLTFDNTINESVNELASNYRKIAETVAKREVCGKFSEDLRVAGDKLVQQRVEHLRAEIEDSLVKFGMAYTDIITNLTEGIKTYDQFDSKNYKTYSKKVGRTYLHFRKEGVTRMHRLCDELYNVLKLNNSQAKLVDRAYLKFEREKIKLNDYSILESRLDYYDKKLNGEFTGDFNEIITDRSVLKNLDNLAKETKLFEVLVCYSIFKSIKPELTPHAVARTGVDMHEFSSVLSDYSQSKSNPSSTST